ncbi:uncharacterized protein LOC128882247, partial [Hylaeus volcanicus]|uniref:uncharacterized protein LOC128882247 n=1 Tax=Hylaeus volcanicus TaxID=313075 RepID=UPI0023B7EFB8
MTYSEVMAKAVAGVRLRDVGVTGIRYRKGQTGSSILEIPGPDSAAGADRLAGRLAELFAGTDVRVSRPIKSAEARVSGLDESVTADGVAAAVAAVTGCPVDRVQTGIIRRSGSGLGTVWLRCPAAAMKALLATGRLLVGWSFARVEALPARALRCFRCLELGHVRQKCPSRRTAGTGATANLNDSARAQDLFIHCLAELGVGLAVAAVPYRVADRPNWVADALGSVVIVGSDTAALRVFARGDGFVGAECGGLALIGVYAPPSAPLAAFEWLLDGIRDALSRSPVARMLVLGDFNAKSTAWGGPATDARVRAVLEWATPAASRLVSGWGVAEEVESLSDHLYILMDVSAAPRYHPARGPAPGRPPRRWALKRLEKDALMAAALAASWPDAPAGPVADVDQEADWFRESLTAACDAAMPRARKLSRRAAYSWSDEIAALRATCSAARRRFTKARRRRNRDPAREAALYEVYREATVDLQRAIRRAKASAWGELLRTLDKDPWGRPYRIVLGCMRPAAPPVTESLDPPVLERIVDTLFPVDPEEGPRPLLPAEASNWSAGLGVTEEELWMAVGRIVARNTAPGPDGIPGRALALALRVLGTQLRRLFDGCLEWIEYPGRGVVPMRRRASRGVPQGSVLGPLLWNFGYDSVLRGLLPPGVFVVCYADDTLIIAVGRDGTRVHRLAELAAAIVVARIQALGLRISPQKTE